MDWKRLMQVSDNNDIILYAKSERLDAVYSEQQIVDFVNGKTDSVKSAKLKTSNFIDTIRARIANNLHSLADAISPELS